MKSRKKGQERLGKIQKRAAEALQADLGAFPDLCRVISLLLENAYLWLMTQLIHG